jgi:hypothetical protein
MRQMDAEDGIKGPIGSDDMTAEEDTAWTSAFDVVEQEKVRQAVESVPDTPPAPDEAEDEEAEAETEDEEEETEEEETEDDSDEES